MYRTRAVWVSVYSVCGMLRRLPIIKNVATMKVVALEWRRNSRAAWDNLGTHVCQCYLSGMRFITLSSLLLDLVSFFLPRPWSSRYTSSYQFIERTSFTALFCYLSWNIVPHPMIPYREPTSISHPLIWDSWWSIIHWSEIPDSG